MPKSPVPSSPPPEGGWSPHDAAAFRWLTLRYESVARDRSIVAGQLRAIFEGRDPAWAPFATDAPANALLADIRRGRRDTPAPLAATYRELCEAEATIRDDVAAALARHPVAPWLSRIHGVGTILAAQLLARLDRARASRPSSFWAFCGLATVPAVVVECAVCGATLEVPQGARPPRTHADQRDPARRCTAPFGEAQPGKVVRVATSRGAPEVQRKHDEAARSACHLIGLSMVRTNGTYARVYREARERFQRERQGWSSGRIHLSALRVMEKRFLLDLWHAWPAPEAAVDRLMARADAASPPDSDEGGEATRAGAVA